METIHANIIAEIQAVRLYVKNKLNDAIGTLKSELVDFRGVNAKLNGISSELKQTIDRVDAMELRVAELVERNADHAEMLTCTLNLQQAFQAQLTDLEARSHRNNISIHGIPEGVEGDDMKSFLEELFKNELSLTDTPFGIQCCHRLLGTKPPQGANPRSVLVCFQEYSTKEWVLCSAWQKKVVKYSGKRRFFEQDYPRYLWKERRKNMIWRNTISLDIFNWGTIPTKIFKLLKGWDSI